jgi:hypothetical protein
MPKNSWFVLLFSMQMAGVFTPCSIYYFFLHKILHFSELLWFKSIKYSPISPPPPQILTHFRCNLLFLQLCVWNSDGWEKQKARFLQVPAGRTPTAQSDTRVQFHQDQIHFLVVHETQLAIYETTKLECVKQVLLSLKSTLLWN